MNSDDGASTSSKRSAASSGKGSSEVWQYFTKHTDGKNFATCNICRKEYATCGNTSNMMDHMKRKHKSILHPETESDLQEEVSSIKKTKLQTLPSFIEKSKMYEASNKKKLELDRRLMLFVAGGLHPFSIVNEPSFIALMKAADSRYRLPSKTTLRYKLITETYNKLFKRLQDILILNEVNYVALITDLWTSSAAESYISVTCHFIFRNTLKSAVLEASQVTGSQTAEYIKTVLENIITRWNLQNKVTCIVTDNANNMVNACTLLQIRNLPCLAHTLNLTVNDGLKDSKLSDLLQSSRNIVGHFKRSPQATEKLLLDQKNKGEKDPKKLIQDVPTRWNSTFLMIERLILLWDYVMVTLLKLPSAPKPLDANDLNILKDAVDLLKPFQTLTNEISSENYVTSSLIIPMVLGLHKRIVDAGQKLENEDSKDLYNKLKTSIEQRLFKYESRTVPRISTILDPRFKKLAFRSVDNAQQACNAIQGEFGQICNKLKENEITLQNIEPIENTTTDGDNLLLFLEDRIKHHKDLSTTKSDSIIVMRQYLEKLNLPRNIDPINYWENQDLEEMKIIGRKYLCVPATSVPSEQIFSKTGLIVSDRRASLKPDAVNKLTFINQNQWLLEFD